MSDVEESTLVMVDDNVDEIFLARRHVRRDGFVNRFVSEKKPERLPDMLDEMVEMGISKDSFLLLLDVNMPKQNGFETLRKIRQHPKYKDTLVFMLSSSDDTEDIFEAFELGCNGYITKPISGEKLMNALESVPRIRKKLLQ